MMRGLGGGGTMAVTAVEPDDPALVIGIVPCYLDVRDVHRSVYFEQCFEVVKRKGGKMIGGCYHQLLYEE